MARRFAVAHDQEAENDEDPVHVVRDDGAVGRGVLPPQDGVEDAPAAAAVELWVAELGGVRWVGGEGELGGRCTLMCHTLLVMS